MIEIKARYTGEVLLIVNKTSLVGANLRDANLEYANLRGADLRDANLVGTNLRDANLEYADLECADLRDANLVGTNLKGADLEGADLEGADLEYADLVGTNLRGAKGIKSFQCGNYNRVSYAVKWDNCVMFKIGCFWGDTEQAIGKVREKYGTNSYYEKLIRLYTEMLNEEN